MRLHSLTVCLNENERLSGLNFHLAENAYTDEPGNRVDLGAIGKLEGTCKTLKLSQSVDRIRASDRVKSRVKIVEDMMILSGQYALNIGEVSEEFTQWVFDEKEPLVGVYGRQWDDITQMGFITLDIACQASIIEEQEIVDEPVVELKETMPIEEESELLLYLTDERYVEEHIGITGFDMLTIFMMSFLIMISICLLISVCACLSKARKIRKEARNFVVPVNFDPTKVITTVSTGAVEVAS